MPDRSPIAVLGAGIMGNGIAHVFARAGHPVHLVDTTQPILDRALQTIRASLASEVAATTLTDQDAEASLARIQPHLTLDTLPSVPLAIEALPERFELKREIFQALDQRLPPDAILASNTSSISITRLAAVTSRPDKVIGMHFFNPVPVIKLAEIVRGLETSQSTFNRIRICALALGKTPVEVNDTAGFLSNRILMPFLNEAIFAVMEKIAPPEAIDTTFREGLGHPMGPLAQADAIGLDVCLDLMRVLEEGLGEPKYRPCPLLIRMVDAGWLGRKSGRGFFQYS